MRWKRPILIASAVLIGVLPGFFFVFAGAFTDAPAGFAHPERLLSYVLVVASYAALGAVFAWLGPGEGWRWGVWGGLAAVLMLAWYTTREPQAWGLHLFYGLLAVGAAAAAGHVVSRAKARRTIEA